MNKTMREPSSSEPVPPLAHLLADQRERWARGDCVRVEALLQQHPGLAGDTDGLLDLIYNEVFLRERRGETPLRDEYLQRFPDLATALRVQFDVHQAIQAGAAPEDETDLPTIPGYELLAEIGHGGMGRVYKARDTKRGRVIAVKVLRAEHSCRREVRRRFAAEARAAAALDHPNIIQVLEVGDCASGPYFTMELIEGPSLEEVIRRGPPHPVQSVHWLIAVAEAAHYAHGQGIIHRDLKPANVMIDGGGQPRVMDFGMAKILRRAAVAGISSTRQGIILGTPAYMPPEQADHDGPGPGPYSDVYSLGAILYALLTGRPPFDEGSFLTTILKVRSDEAPQAVRSLRPEVPQILERICHTCLNKRLIDRYPTARALAAALRDFLQRNGQSTPVPAVTLVRVATGGLLTLVKETTVIGRSMECDVVLTSPDVSRRHCRIGCTPGQVLLEDLGSSQGTRVNGSPVKRAQLHDGDRLEVAGEVFQVYLGQPHD
jgi:serine/threonine protein kinase